MKSLLKIYGKYIGVTWAVILALFIGNAGVFLWILSEQLRNADQGGIGGIPALEKEAYWEEEGEGVRLSGAGKKYMEDKQYVFLMVLDDTGEVIYDWNLPKELKKKYTYGEVAAFSRWYLEDYPVKVWNTERGLLVAGSKKGSIWKHRTEFQMTFIENIGRYIHMLLQINLLIVLGIIGWMGYRYYRSLCPLAEGINALASNHKIRLSEKGITSDLAAGINRASHILEEQRERLEQRDVARTEWIAGVSHDIRTPLSLIVGFADELETDQALGEERRGKAAVIKSQSLRIRQLIEDLNLTSKLEYHMQPLRMESFYPAELLRELAAEQINQGLPEQYELTLEMEEAFESIVLRGDRELFARAVRNLLNNSIRHNVQGCSILVRGERTADACVVKIEDNGRGIPLQVRELLEQEDNRNRTPEAAGDNASKPHIMGLRIVKQIALAHQGGFQIEEDGHRVKLSFPIENGISCHV